MKKKTKVSCLLAGEDGVLSPADRYRALLEAVPLPAEAQKKDSSGGGGPLLKLQQQAGKQ